MVWKEVQIVVERQNREMANMAVLFQMAASSAFNGKKAHEQFKRRIEELADSGED